MGMRGVVMFLVLVFLLGILEASPFELEEFSLLYNEFSSTSRHIWIDQLEDRRLNKELSLIFDIGVWNGLLFWDNKIHGLMDKRRSDNRHERFRTVGWEFRFGFRPFEFLDIHYHHFSNHLLDYDWKRFPVEDAIGAKIYFVRD